MIIKDLKSRKSATLLEVLICVIIIGIVAALGANITYNAVKVTGYTRNEFIASNLAREGIEAVRNIVETNRLRCGKSAPDAWILKSTESACTGDELDSSDPGGTDYTIGLDSVDLLKWDLDDTADTVLYKHDWDGATLYNHISAGGTASPFKRVVNIEFNDSDGIEKLIVKSKVTWKNDQRWVEIVGYVN
jgi:type II secretory pathway pseudopilin PulG